MYSSVAVLPRIDLSFAVNATVGVVGIPATDNDRTFFILVGRAEEKDHWETWTLDEKII
jgi:hypothetical protein